jgi:hypothetical protein
MAQADLLQTLEKIKELNTDELRQVQQAVQAQLDGTDEAAAKKAFHQALLDAGLVKEIKTPPRRDDRERPLVTIRGKPLSETIIEERR